MPHNHEPRCCCRTDRPDNVCPSCVEHGELATLGQCPEESPSTGLRCLRETGHPGGHNTTNAEPWLGECASCHAHDGHPHTDYCQRENRDYPGQPGVRPDGRNLTQYDPTAYPPPVNR